MSIVAIKKLRTLTGAGFMDCQKALLATSQDEKKALEWLKKKGLLQAEKKTFRQAKQGQIASYIHSPGRMGVLVEVNVETDFAARGKDFNQFVHQLCLHITAMHPLFISPSDIPKERQEKEKEYFKAQALKAGKPKGILEKVATGKWDKWVKDQCLMKQIFLASSQTDSPCTVEDALKNLIARLGENIIIRRFVRFELGQEESHIASSMTTSQRTL